MKLNDAHLAYCTNIHPAESWEETWNVLKKHTLAVRDQVATSAEPYAIGLRLSAIAADELLQGDALIKFQDWLTEENCYVFTINGFPYGSFHGTRVKEKVYQPDWSTPDRLEYTNNLFIILAQLVPKGIDGSVSTLPGSFKEFRADETAVFKNLEACAKSIEALSKLFERDLHLGLEPEPLGHFENTEETLAFFERFLAAVDDPDLVRRRIGINYDTCHFALEFDDCKTSLDALRNAGLRISKVHLSSALEFDPTSNESLEKIKAFDEPTYLHQVIIQDNDGQLTRFKDLPEYLETRSGKDLTADSRHLTPAPKGRIHFHIPLYAQPEPPLGSTQDHAIAAVDYLNNNPDFCSHFEIETYTWGVLPNDLQIPIEQQIAKEYEWVLAHI
ncbi:MAG: metabolite traffic protein EboE [Verrucomicrobiae bacterium]|nr:metabolite traffic protein EboE [Verrucomicrobiae bacterium]NNJ87011.1 metabolite traffic protein EboE [Akkermansiaceae bacterium]